MDRLGPTLLWRLWKSRNDYLCKDVEYNALYLTSTAQEDAEEWGN